MMSQMDKDDLTTLDLPQLPPSPLTIAAAVSPTRPLFGNFTAKAPATPLGGFENPGYLPEG